MDERSHTLELLQGRRFGELNRLLNAAQEAFEKDFHRERRLVWTVQTFSNPDPQLAPLFAEWARQYPNLYTSHLARGCYYAKMGWAARGTEFASDTTESQFGAMDAFFGKAIQDFRITLKLNPKAIVAYHELIEIGENRPGNFNEDELVREALKVCPACYRTRQLYLFSLEPRWGGSYAQMERFATESQKYAVANPALKLLPGFVFFEQGRDLLDNKNYAMALPLFSRAINFGENDQFYYYRGVAYRNLGQYQQALSDLTRAIAIQPSVPDFYKERYFIYSKFKNYDAALADLRIARKIDTNDPWLIDAERNLVAYLSKYRPESSGR